MSDARGPGGRLFIGLMSGTSLDGVDGVLARFNHDDRLETVLGHRFSGFPADLRAELLALNQAGPNELDRAERAANALMDVYAEVVGALLEAAGVSRSHVVAVGAHGQTVRHRPRTQDGGYTTQLANGARLAERCGIDVVCDFRRRDVAAGGEGAPLVPAFHAIQFGQPGQTRAVVNIGGIANVTRLSADGTVRGHDTGPGNVLMDGWCRQHTGQAFDAEGRWARQGRELPELLARWRSDPYFALPAPKSTGRDLFDAAWLAARLPGDAAPVDVMATLVALTAETIAADLLVDGTSPPQSVWVCGGGAFNHQLMQRLAQAMGGQVPVASTAVLGVPPDQVEALAFAWLAAAFTSRRPGNVPAVTGASGPRVLGALYPA